MLMFCRRSSQALSSSGRGSPRYLFHFVRVSSLTIVTGSRDCRAGAAPVSVQENDLGETRTLTEYEICSMTVHFLEMKEPKTKYQSVNEDDGYVNCSPVCG